MAEVLVRRTIRTALDLGFFATRPAEQYLGVFFPPTWQGRGPHLGFRVEGTMLLSKCLVVSVRFRNQKPSTLNPVP